MRVVGPGGSALGPSRLQALVLLFPLPISSRRLQGGPAEPHQTVGTPDPAIGMIQIALSSTVSGVPWSSRPKRRDGDHRHGAVSWCRCVDIEQRRRRPSSPEGAESQACTAELTDGEPQRDVGLVKLGFGSGAEAAGSTRRSHEPLPVGRCKSLASLRVAVWRLALEFDSGVTARGKRGCSLMRGAWA